MEELKRLMEWLERANGHAPPLTGLALSARKNLCVHPEVRLGMAEIAILIWERNKSQYFWQNPDNTFPIHSDCNLSRCLDNFKYWNM